MTSCMIHRQSNGFRVQEVGTYRVESKGSTQPMSKSKRVNLGIKEGVHIYHLEGCEPGR